MSKYSLKGIIASALIAAIFSLPAFAESKRPPRDNDDDYKLPIFVPKVAQPNAPAKIIFQDEGSANDEMYAMPRKTSPIAPAAPAYQPPQPQYRQPPTDADSYYRLPDQYNPQRNQQMPQQVVPSRGYYQKYDYNDTRDNATPNGNNKDDETYPAYYY